MLVDWQTLRDLAILQPERSKASIFEWADFTRTQGGLQRLKEHFRAPLSNPHEIRRRQQAVAFLARHAGLLDPLLGGSAWLTVTRYAHANVTVFEYPNPVVRWLDSWWVRMRERDLFEEVRAGLAMVQTLAHSGLRVVERIRELGPPPLVHEWTERVGSCLAAPAFSRLCTGKDVHRRSPSQVLRADGAFRSDRFEPLLQLTRLVYEIDALCSLALATRNHGLVLPEILDRDAPFVEAEGLYHPLLDEAVPNPLEISAERRLLFLTGPNMAGKSTYLKAVGIAVHLAQLGMGVPARGMRLVPFGCLFSGVDTTDNLRLGQSYFFREVRRVREVAEVLAGGTSSLVIFDEMFRGTNLKDASDACLAVLSGFAACSDSAFLIASHISELAAPMEALAGTDFLHFAAAIRDGAPVFDYRLHRGVSEQRLGMLILERERVLDLLGRLRAPAE